MTCSCSYGSGADDCLPSRALLIEYNHKDLSYIGFKGSALFSKVKSSGLIMFGTDAKKDIDDTSETRMGPKDLASYTQ